MFCMVIDHVRAGLAAACIILGCQPAAAQAPADAPAAQPDGQPTALDLVWSVRSGLNVAAFLCRDAVLVDHYNQIIRRHAAVLGMAYGAQEQRFRAAFGGRWERAFNDALTRQFNRYSLLPDRTAYCRWAAALAADLVQRPADELPGLAVQAAATLQNGPILVATQ
jgi:hypothetical protein